ncbi:ATP-binding protein [Streptomyces sp. NPDC048518]|uniref:ATP-binding protein n=1 Tax=Streptomyces sp. NPDC048518 TaxID=3155029 RepID=UPI003404E642
MTTTHAPRTEDEIVLSTSRKFSEPSDCTPGEARAYVRITLTDWGAPAAVSRDLQLIVSELTTNAVTYTRSPQVEVSITLAGREASVSVSDCGPHRHLTAELAAPDAEHGRGLVLVEAFASWWEQRESDDGGTTVVAAVPLPDHERPSCPSTRRPA